MNQGIGIRGKEMALVWHEKASRTALQTSSLLHTHTLLVIFFTCKFDYIYIKYILTLFLSKQLTKNKCTFRECTNTAYTYNTRLQFGINYTHSFGTDTHT